MTLLRKGGVPRPLLPPDPPGHDTRIAFRGHRNFVFAGIAERILHRSLQSAEDLRRSKIDGVRPPQVEARRGTRAESRLAGHVGRGDEITAAHPEKAQRVAELFEWGIHIA